MTNLLTRWRQLLVLSLLLLCSVGELFARPLSERQARHLAEQFFLQSTHTTKSRPISQQGLQLVSAPVRDARGLQLRTLTGEEARYYYIYNRGSNEGFVIIAGDDELTPYIGYATTGRFVVENMPEQLAAFLKACQERIDELASSISYHQALQPTRPSASEPTHIDPLLGNIQWNQSAPWNDQTPVVDGKHTPVGCVATAYTQVMRYHKWPTQGEGTFSYKEKRSDRQHSVDYGSTTYDWEHMPERYDDPSRATEEETKALSTLAYHAGVAVEMMYALGGSGAYMPYVDRALRDHFRYDKRVSFKSRANYTQATWEQLLRNELIAARPIVYSGYGSGGGHAFVCDGYDAEGLFHINWGWGGMSDGYFNLNYLVPSDLGIGGGAGGGFSLGQGAVIGIMPDRTGTSQRTVSSVVTTWRFSMRFDEGTLDAAADYKVALVDDATPYDDLITYGVTRLGSADTTYLDQYARNVHLEGLYQIVSIEGQKLQLKDYINEGTWNFFLAYRAKKGTTGDTLWRPCGQHESAKDQSCRTFTISREGDGSYTVTEDASSNQPKLELVTGSAQSHIVGYEKSQVALQLRNTGRVEYFEQLYLFAKKAGENQFQELLNILPAIEAGGQERVTFDLDRFPYGSGDVELEVGYFVGERLIPVWSNTVSIQQAKDVRTAYVLSSDQPVTVNVNSGNLSQIRIRNIGTKTPTNRVLYRWELRKEKQTASTRWTQIDIPAGGEQLVAPNLAGELSQIGAKRGDNITLTATFIEVNDEGRRIISIIPLMEEPKLSVYCDGELVVGDGVITMTTAKSVGENISFAYFAEGDVVIEGATGTPKEREDVVYTLTSQQVSLRGDFTVLACMENELTNLDVSQCSSLEALWCCLNQIKGEAMTQLVNSLPDRTGKKAGTFVVYSHFQGEKNICLKSDVAIAKAKNWQVALATIENGKVKLYLYEGEDDSQPSVGDGVITMTTSRAVGEQIMLAMRPVEGQTVIAEGLQEPLILDDLPHRYTLTSQTVTLKGNLKSLNCNGLYSQSGPPSHHQNQLTSLDVSRCNTLSELYCSENLLQSLDVSSCKTLRELYCSENSLQSLDITHNEALTRLYCFNNQLETLDLSHARALTSLNVSENRLTALDLSQCLNLRYANLFSNQLTHLDVSHNGELEELECYGNQIKGEAMTALVNGLPDRMDKEPGRFQVIGQDAKTDGNICLKSDVAIAKGKNWSVQNLYGKPYEGEDDSQPSVGDGVITMTTAKSVGESISLSYLADGDVSIEGAEGTPRPSDYVDYTLTNQQVTLRGDITELDCSANRLTDIDVSQCSSLRVIACNVNEIKGKSMLQLVNSLPDRTGLESGTFLVYSDGSLGQEGNVCLKSDVAIARAKNWEVYLDIEENGELKRYRYDGEDPTKTFAVTLTQGDNGTISATGADDLNAVPEGTELTITDQPDEDYILVALTANGEDILSTKKLIVREDTEIEATFAKMNYTVTFTQEGEGTLTATGADDLNAVPYGTELTVEATPAEGYELTALTANGEDILATKKLSVREDTEIKATFTKKTFAVTFTKEGEGALTATGADDLNAVPYGTELTVEAAPAEGYELTALTANGKDILSSKQFIVKEATEVKATFTKKTFAVTFTKEGEGTITATGADDLKAVPYGTELTIKATPAEGYELKKLLANGFEVPQSKSFVVTEKTTIKAVFRKKTYPVTLTPNEHGTISIVEGVDSERVPYGTELTIKATPAEGYELTALMANGKDILSSKQFIVKEATEVKATFTKKTFAVTFTKEGEGTITATGADDLKAVPYGTELTVKAAPAEGYELTALTANGKDILSSKQFIVKEATEVKATFTKKSFAVSLTKEGEGTITATGTDDLKAVPYGTELTVEATPAEGYELTALTANGEDILSTKKFTVQGATEVKATFTKKTYPVTLKPNEHGTISIVEPVNLEAVPYGTTLTVKASGKNAQCELTALTANGKDILSTKQFTVQGATEVKATFVDRTGVETIGEHDFRIYPNPAQTFVLIEGLQPASQVTLYSMTGEQLYTGQTDQQGTLRIDLTALSDGVYLLVGEGWQKRLVVKQ